MPHTIAGCGHLEMWKCIFFIYNSQHCFRECTGNHGLILVVKNSSRFDGGVISEQVYFDSSSDWGEE